MDGNKDDALKCLRIGKEALESGDRSRALKFVTKARRLDPTLLVDDLLSAIEADAGDPPADASATAAAAEPSKPPDQPSIRRRASAAAGSSLSSASYTEEQISIVREIRRKKNLYEILGLERSCSVEDVRKSYRKLSLKVHPDKNKAPGAEEAFKAVSKAFQCLSNEESRRKYDISGEDEAVYEQRARPAARAYNGYYEADIDAEEIFRNFFFGGMAPATNFGGFSFGPGGFNAHRPAEHGSGGGFNVRALIQLLPVLLILLINFLPSSEPLYSLSKSYPYEHRFTTPKGVNFYVKSTNFAQEYPPQSEERAVVDERVEREYFSILRQNCRFEMQRRQWGYIRETPHCDMLHKFDTVN
ncbi:chaperone protein dnaJ 49 [Cajanus cajan]|uniref:chaperone protein dnaJ 49 n=1 Tax=Cajanus cajan TaxID=3821 RepID=UPI00098DACC9|nr:chaperone protein dnaJ 49 [Cajanus cajan]